MSVPPRTSPETLAAKEPPRPRLKGVFVTIVLSVLVFAALSVASDLGALEASLAGFRGSALLWAVALVMGNYVLRFLRWQYYLRHLDLVVTVPMSALVFLSGFVMSVTPGKMGEVFKSVLLYEYRGIGIARTASIVVAERLMDLVALVLLVAITSLGFPHGGTITVFGALVVLGIVLFATVRPLSLWCFEQMATLAMLRPIVPRLREAYEALYTLTRLRPFVVGGLLALAGWALECLATYVIVQGFVATSTSPAGAAFSYAAGTLAGALAMLPGGLGVAELGMTGLLRAVSDEITPATAAAATILVRLCTLWYGVGLGACSLVVLRAVGKPGRG